MHRRRKRVFVGSEDRSCSICQRNVPTLLTILGSGNPKPLKTNVVDNINRCGHDFCEQCYQSKFSQAAKPFFECPICQATVTQKQLKSETLAEIDAKREREERKYIKRIRCKNRDYFSNTPEYNTYLDESEQLVWNLVNYIDVKAIRQNLKDAERDNKKEIEYMESARNKIRTDQLAIVNSLTEEKKRRDLRFKQIDQGLIKEDEDFDKANGGGEYEQVVFGAVTLNQPQPIGLGSKQNLSGGGLNVISEMRAGGFDFIGANNYSKFRLRSELSFKVKNVD